MRGRVQVEVGQGRVEVGEGEGWLVVPPGAVEGEVWWCKEDEGDLLKRGHHWDEVAEVSERIVVMSNFDI